MKGVINDQIVLLRAPEGPLVVYLDRFASATSKKGYAVRSVHRQVFLAADFSRWLKQEGIKLRGMSNDCPKQYLQYRYRQLQPDRGDFASGRQSPWPNQVKQPQISLCDAYPRDPS